jgi:hypothetical protein
MREEVTENSQNGIVTTSEIRVQKESTTSDPLSETNLE